MATNPKRKASRATQKAKLDALCRSLVMMRDGRKCVRCGSTEWVQWSHVYTRRILCMRWNTLNSKVLCASCHRWWHDNPAEAAMWWHSWSREALHPDAPEILQGIRSTMPEVDLERIALQLAAQIAKMQGM